MRSWRSKVRPGAGFGPVASTRTWSPETVTLVTDQLASFAHRSATACTSLCRTKVLSIRSELICNGTITTSRSAAMMAMAPP